MDKCARDIAMIIEDVQGSMSIPDKEVFLRQQTKQLGVLVQTYSAIWSDKEKLVITNRVYRYKVEYLASRVKRSLNIVAKFCRNLIFEIVVDCCKDDGKFTRLLFGLVKAYNDALDLDCNVSSQSTSVNIYSNDCPSMLEPLKKISVTRILQVLAKNKAEENCHELIDCLLMNYQPRNEEEMKSPQSWDVEMSENSSIEIYRALTKHMTPPGDIALPTEKNNPDKIDPVNSENVESIETLVENQSLHVDKLMDAIREIYPQLFGMENIKYDCRGETKVKKSALTRLSDYYQHVVWAAISGILDHVVLWWSPEGLAARHSQGAHHLKDWLRRFIQTNEISSIVRPALLNLCDALGCHVTATCWDELFRLAYIASFECCSKPFSSEGTDTGQMFAELWLDYIYLHRIKFSEFGALQLLTDFAHVSRWVTDCPIISQGVKGHLLKNELLRRCEGVGRLLLRHPGEAIAMQKRRYRRTNDNGSPQSLGLERMPAEMYVPNQQQWLELRASKTYKLYCCTD
ncbi:uncharacterized protein [Fopius arisanus]|uniref:Coiled-coil protein 142 C-terminal domain-containing protein n=1 Tax=Fopius arisanus TaxID=64838 RepID=A0A9R1T1S7_9HYME|nr:PREDICTED: uncharacterized protein LOC105265290 [Fopius arisanus]